MKKPTPPRLRKFPAAKQRRMDELLQKNSEGETTPEEAVLLKKLVWQAEQLMAANAKRLAEFAKSEITSTHTDATPVTVWVRPTSHAKR